MYAYAYYGDMATQERRYRDWLPPALIVATLLDLTFTLLGIMWSTPVAAVTFLILSVSIGFFGYHWGHLPVLYIEENSDRAIDRVRSTRSAVVEWWQSNSDVLIVLGVDLVGVIGLLFTSQFKDDKAWYSLIATWGGHGDVVMVAIALGIIASIIGITRYRTSGRQQKDWGAQLTVVGLWTMSVASALPLLVLAGMVALSAVIMIVIAMLIGQALS